MKWNEVSDKTVSISKTGQVLTNVECPKCGGMYLDDSLILTSYPVKYKYWCPCGWVGYAHVRSEGNEWVF